MYHAHVATAEFLMMNFRTHQICLLFADSVDVSLQQEIVSRMSQIFHFFSTRNIERFADNLEDVLDSAFDVLEVLNLRH